MKLPDIPQTERERLAALKQYEILDTAQEQEFNDIVLLAASLCQMPIAAISLIDASRQWFKSAIGLCVQETPRDYAFCAHTILQDDVMVVADTYQDARFADNPLVQGEPYIRFYAGVPLITKEGHALGSLCVIDRQPRELTIEQQVALKALANQVLRLMDMRISRYQLVNLNHELTSANAQLSAAFEAIPNVISIMNPAGEYLGCNSSFERLVGVTREKVIGHNLEALHGKKNAKKILSFAKKALASRKPVELEEWLTFSDGYHGLFHSTYTAIRGADGELVGVLLLSQDITQHRTLTAKLTRKQDAFKTLNEIASQAMHIDLHTRMSEMLKVGARYLGFDFGVIGKLEHGQYHVLVSTTSVGRIEEGFTCPQTQTLCQFLLDKKDAEILFVSDIPHSKYAQVGCYQNAEGIQSFLGMLMKESDAVYHSIAFMNVATHDVSFSLADAEFIQLLGRWISTVIARERMAESILQSNQRMELALEGANLGLWDWHVPSGALVFNARWYQMLGYTPDTFEPTIAMFESLIHPEDKSHFFKALESHFKGETPVMHVDFRMRHSDGSWVWVENYSRAMAYDDAGAPVRLLGTHMDITKRKMDEVEIKQLAFYDALTQLPNRRLLMDRLSRALVTSARTECHGALFFIDIDHFKTLNDTLGHDKGDALLKQVAERLKQSVRDADTVARLGGDEFVVMLENLDVDDEVAVKQVDLVGKKILAALYQPYLIDDGDYFGTASIGVTLFHGHQDSLEELLKRADMAMYQAKGDGRNCMRYFDPHMQAEVKGKAILADDMRAGMKANQFLLHYQPQIDLEGRLTGAEALLRWKHPKRGMVPPNQFIPVAEDTGIILRLGRQVLEMGCNQLVAWSKLAHTANVVLSVNVSARQFHQPEFVNEVLEILGWTGANPRMLKLELTESMLVEDVEDVIQKMTLLRKEGVRFSLDDFGTGFSSLSYLKRLPLNQLKIDQSFVRDVLTDPNDAVIACTIVALARSLGLDVIAEGVETEAQRDFLAENGCHDFQGYYFSKPLSVEQFNEYSFSLNFSHYALRNANDEYTLTRLSAS